MYFWISRSRSTKILILLVLGVVLPSWAFPELSWIHGVSFITIGMLWPRPTPPRDIGVEELMAMPRNEMKREIRDEIRGALEKGSSKLIRVGFIGGGSSFLLLSVVR